MKLIIKVTQNLNRPDIADYDIEIRYIPLDEKEENQRIRQLCYLLFQEIMEDLQKSNDICLTSV